MVQQMCDTALSLDLAKQDPTSWAFHNAVVICYARPFTANDSVGALGAKWEKFDDPQLQANHDVLMRQRDEVVAHAELGWRPIVLAGPNTQLPSGVITVNPGIITLRPVLDPVSYEAVIATCADLLPRLTAAFDECFLQMYPGGYDGPPTHLLPVGEDEPPIKITFTQ